METSKRNLIIIGGIVLLAIVIGLMIFFTQKDNDDNNDTANGDNNVATCGIEVIFTDEKEIGKVLFNKETIYNELEIKVTVQNTCTERKSFDLYLVRLSNSTISDDNMNYKFGITSNETIDGALINTLRSSLLSDKYISEIESITNENVSTAYIIASGDINGREKMEYKLSLSTDTEMTNEDTYNITLIATESE